MNKKVKMMSPKEAEVCSLEVKPFVNELHGPEDDVVAKGDRVDSSGHESKESSQEDSRVFRCNMCGLVHFGPRSVIAVGTEGKVRYGYDYQGEDPGLLYCAECNCAYPLEEADSMSGPWGNQRQSARVVVREEAPIEEVSMVMGVDTSSFEEDETVYSLCEVDAEKGELRATLIGEDEAAQRTSEFGRCPCKPLEGEMIESYIEDSLRDSLGLSASECSWRCDESGETTPDGDEKQERCWVEMECQHCNVTAMRLVPFCDGHPDRSKIPVLGFLCPENSGHGRMSMRHPGGYKLGSFVGKVVAHNCLNCGSDPIYTRLGKDYDFIQTNPCSGCGSPRTFLGVTGEDVEVHRGEVGDCDDSQCACCDGSCGVDCGCRGGEVSCMDDKSEGIDSCVQRFWYEVRSLNSLDVFVRQVVGKSGDVLDVNNPVFGASLVEVCHGLIEGKGDFWLDYVCADCGQTSLSVPVTNEWQGVERCVVCDGHRRRNDDDVVFVAPEEMVANEAEQRKPLILDDKYYDAAVQQPECADAVRSDFCQGKEVLRGVREVKWPTVTMKCDSCGFQLEAKRGDLVDMSQGHFRLGWPSKGEVGNAIYCANCDCGPVCEVSSEDGIHQDWAANLDAFDDRISQQVPFLCRNCGNIFGNSLHHVAMCPLCEGKSDNLLEAKRIRHRGFGDLIPSEEDRSIIFRFVCSVCEQVYDTISKYDMMNGKQLDPCNVCGSILSFDEVVEEDGSEDGVGPDDHCRREAPCLGLETGEIFPGSKNWHCGPVVRGESVLSVVNLEKSESVIILGGYKGFQMVDDDCPQKFRYECCDCGLTEGVYRRYDVEHGLDIPPCCACGGGMSFKEVVPVEEDVSSEEAKGPAPNASKDNDAGDATDACGLEEQVEKAMRIEYPVEVHHIDNENSGHFEVFLPDFDNFGHGWRGKRNPCCAYGFCRELALANLDVVKREYFAHCLGAGKVLPESSLDARVEELMKAEYPIKVKKLIVPKVGEDGYVAWLPDFMDSDVVFEENQSFVDFPWALGISSCDAAIALDDAKRRIFRKYLLEGKEIPSPSAGECVEEQIATPEEERSKVEQAMSVEYPAEVTVIERDGIKRYQMSLPDFDGIEVNDDMTKDLANPCTVVDRDRDVAVTRLSARRGWVIRYCLKRGIELSKSSMEERVAELVDRYTTEVVAKESASGDVMSYVAHLPAFDAYCDTSGGLSTTNPCWADGISESEALNRLDFMRRSVFEAILKNGWDLPEEVSDGFDEDEDEDTTCDSWDAVKDEICEVDLPRGVPEKFYLAIRNAVVKAREKLFLEEGMSQRERVELDVRLWNEVSNIAYDREGELRAEYELLVDDE